MNTLPTSAWSLTTVTVPNKNSLLRSPEWVGGKKNAALLRQLGPLFEECCLHDKWHAGRKWLKAEQANRWFHYGHNRNSARLRWNWDGDRFEKALAQSER